MLRGERGPCHRARGGDQLGAMKTIRDQLKPGAHGLGFGDWRTILKEIKGQAARKAPDEPIADLKTFLADADAHDALKRLSDRRNDESTCAAWKPWICLRPPTRR